MKTVINFLVVILTSLLAISCSVSGSFQGLYSYYSKTKSKNPSLLLKPDDPYLICQIDKPDSARVYIINGENLKGCLTKKEKAIIYMWAPKCKGKFCYPLNSLQQKCDRKNITLFIVAEYYDHELMQVNHQTRSPILGIDVEYYNSNRTARYLSKFLYDLTAKEGVKGRFIYFENGLFKKSFEAIEGI